MKTIQSRDNTVAKYLINLATSSRERKKAGHSVLDGAHLVIAYIDAGFTPLSIAIRESAIGSPDAVSLLKIINGKNIALYLMADDIMDKASSLESGASIMAVIDTPPSQSTPHTARAVIVLDNVQDPGNVGSILRSAAAFGIAHALLGHGTAAAWSPKVIRAGQGAHFVVNIEEGADVAVWLKSYPGSRVALVPNDENAAALFTLNLTSPTAFIIGSEGAGISTEVIATATNCASIPMSGKMESLNASACAAIAMYEWHRQQLLIART
jgi:RNA methyltransferase, TrmH family